MTSIFSARRLALVLGFCSILLLSLPHSLQAGSDGDDYDRLDGKGASGEKVNVIEWENNLEIHIAPKGSLKGLSLKLDLRDKNKPVMVIGYRFEGGKPLIRRAILGIPIHEGFKAFRDPDEDDYDKIIISNNALASPIVAYKLDPPPAQLYPDGHPALATGGAPEGSGGAAAAGHAAPNGVDRSVASDPAKSREGDDGTIQPFFMKQ